MSTKISGKAGFGVWLEKAGVGRLWFEAVDVPTSLGSLNYY